MLTRGDVPEIKELASSKPSNGNYLVSIPMEKFDFFKIRKDDFVAGNGHPIAFALYDNNKNPIGVALGRIDDSKNDNDIKGTITFSSVKYNDSTSDYFYQPTEKLGPSKHVKVDFKYSEDRKSLKIFGDGLDKIEQFIITATEKHKLDKAQRSSLENDAPKFAVADVKEAGQAGSIPNKTAKSIQI